MPATLHTTIATDVTREADFRQKWGEYWDAREKLGRARSLYASMPRNISTLEARTREAKREMDEAWLKHRGWTFGGRGVWYRGLDEAYGFEEALEEERKIGSKQG